MRAKFKTFLRLARDTARAMIGIPSYETYVQHLRFKHPDQPIPSYEEFFQTCQTKRYEGRGSGRCC